MSTMISPSASEIIQWDVATWSKALNYWEQKADWSKVKTALELGAREGGLSLWLGLKKIDTICSDLGNIAHTASPLHQKYNVSSYITYASIDATDMPFHNQFDLIVFKSIIGGIGYKQNYDRQKKAFETIHKALKPGGQLLFAENLVASPLHRLLRKRFTDWGTDWRYLNVKELHECMQAFCNVTLKTTGFLSVFGRTEQQKQFLSHIDALLLNHIMPKSWRYMAYGISVK
jgi:SAM-dependent methyltransferase